jgi:PEP-CTERM motif
MRSLTLAAITAAALAGAGVANADVIDQLNLTYASGATFIGTVDISDDFSTVNSFVGVLNGYDVGGGGYLGAGYSDTITALAPGDYGLAPGTYFSQMVDDSGQNWIDFGYSFDASGITLSPGGTDPEYYNGLSGSNNVSYADPLVDSTVTSVPEPGTLALFGLGLLSLGAMRLRRKICRSIR